MRRVRCAVLGSALVSSGRAGGLRPTVNGSVEKEGIGYK